MHRLLYIHYLISKEKEDCMKGRATVIVSELYEHLQWVAVIDILTLTELPEVGVERDERI